MIEWLLSVSPAQLSQGRLVLEGGWAGWLILSLGAALVSHWLINHQLAGLLARRQRRLLWSLRTALLALLALLLLDPVLIAESEEPVRGEVALLLDDTLSMRLDDLADGSRADFVVR
ncbi:MAG: hypothetical protein R3310_17765, partial [Candidatus Competibacteraceae bacterium]|nr:hypothetical protein [Candidatus Competibacteraceae bacterium]